MAYVRVFKHYVHLPFILLGIIEGIVFFSALYIGAFIRMGGEPELVSNLGPLWPRALIFSIVLLITMVALGVYQAHNQEGLSGMMLRTGFGFLISSAVLSMIFFIFPGLTIGRGVIALSIVAAFSGAFLVRVILKRSKQGHLLKKRILVLGSGHTANNILQRLTTSADRRGFILVGFLPVAGEEAVVSRYVLEPLKSMSLREVALRNEVDEIVIALDDRRKGLPIEDLLDCKLSGIGVIDVISFFERETGKVELDLLHPSWMLFSDGFSQSVVRQFSERVFDLLVSLFILLFSWPVIILTIIAIKIEDGVKAPVFYRQIRVGANGKPFKLYKFRSMCQDAEKDGVKWASTNDLRVTRVGAIIRKYRIDELPQVLNVFLGNMGMVGPRPERPEFEQNLNARIPYYLERYRVKPGITGWAQLCYPYGASVEDARQKLKYDLYYVKNNSLLLDIIILIQTVEVVLFGKGAR